MRAVRVSMYGPDLEAITVVMVEDQIRVSIDELVATQRILPGGYVVCDVFETGDDGSEETRVMRATLEGANRHAERLEYEKNSAMLYHYNAMTCERVSEGGVLTQTIPSPLSAETIIDVLEQVAHHPVYRHQLMVAISEDEQIITMRDGTAKIVTEVPS
jgi:hypothetical protein